MVIRYTVFEFKSITTSVKLHFYLQNGIICIGLLREINMAERKTDRRTLLTKALIKDALLELLRNTAYEKITVTALCKEAEITRATFYLHYQNLDQVLDETLDDALRLTELDPKFGKYESSHEAYFNSKQNNEPDIDAFLPACQRAASNPKYRVLFMNDTMSHIILDKLYRKEHSIRIPDIMAAHNLTEWEADIIFRYMLYGNFFVNKSLAWIKNDDWYHAQDLIRKFTAPKSILEKK